MLRSGAGRGLRADMTWISDGSPELLVTCGMLTNRSEVDLNSFFLAAGCGALAGDVRSFKRV